MRAHGGQSAAAVRRSAGDAPGVGCRTARRRRRRRRRCRCRGRGRGGSRGRGGCLGRRRRGSGCGGPDMTGVSAEHLHAPRRAARAEECDPDVGVVAEDVGAVSRRPHPPVVHCGGGRVAFRDVLGGGRPSVGDLRREVGVVRHRAVRRHRRRPVRRDLIHRGVPDETGLPVRPAGLVDERVDVVGGGGGCRRCGRERQAHGDQQRHRRAADHGNQPSSFSQATQRSVH
jgi:hypothetical protein